MFSQGIKSNSASPKYQQVIDIIVDAIKNKRLKKGDILPSVNTTSRELNIAQGTIIKAYQELKKRGIIDSQQGKAFFVAHENISNTQSIFVLVDRVTHYKEILYNTFMDEFDRNVTIDFNFYNYDLRKFEKLILANLGYYNYYVIMPHFNEDVSPILSQIPADKLIILNQQVPGLTGKYAAVFQNFRKDVYESLEKALPLIRKYRSLTLVLESKNRFQFVPDDVIKGFREVCTNYGITFEIADYLQTNRLRKEHAYFIISDRDLVEILKFIEDKQWQLGTEIGLIALDDTPIRGILRGGITVISTDFRQMGLTAARLIRENSREIIENPCSLIVRKSL